MDDLTSKARNPKKRQSLTPQKRNLTANFTVQHRSFDISLPRHRESMRQDILEAVQRKTSNMLHDEQNPLYEDPRDVIGKPLKPPRKRTVQALAVTSPRLSKEHKTVLKEQKKKLTKKYESLVTTLMERCEENIIALSEKDTLITKLKDKLKTVLEYNKLFAKENDQLRSQNEALLKYIEECKAALKAERERNRLLEEDRRTLEERVNKFEMPDRDLSQSAIPLVEVCMSCSSRQILVNQAREHNARLQKDMQAMKDVLYRLNVQLSRYQEKLRKQNVEDSKDVYKPSERYDGFDSLVNASLGFKPVTETISTEDGRQKSEETTTRLVDLSGLLSAQALAPLFDAYQENLTEKDTLISDYEKQFEVINKKSKQIVTENKTLTERLTSLDEELVGVRQQYKKVMVEKETAVIEKATLVERAERAESKLKEVYELYEDKMAAMMRDYETVHREYYAVKNLLEASAGKVARLDELRANTVPADMHERRLEHCKRLLEELKHQYSMESERKNDQITKLQLELKSKEEKLDKLVKENETLKSEMEIALKNVRLYRKAAVIFRQRLKAATARITRVRTSVRRAKNEPLRQALQALDNIKHEIKIVKSRASKSLEELERRIVDQERRASHATNEYKREVERARLALQHKEAIIRSLIDKVADVEEIRLSQSNASHRLQGIVDSPEQSDTKERKAK